MSFAVRMFVVLDIESGVDRGVEEEVFSMIEVRLNAFYRD